MICRLVAFEELTALLRLYAFLHPEDPMVDPDEAAVGQLWLRIHEDPNLLYYAAVDEGRLVSTCTLTLVPNLTRGLQPYGVIENVVTDPAFRRRGYARAVLRHALEEAWRAGGYKVMLATGSKEEGTLEFYEKVGFRRGVKTAFIAQPA